MLNVVEPVFLRLPGRKMIQLSAITDAKWEGSRLFLHFLGGAWMDLTGQDAQVAWGAIEASCLSVTGPADDACA